MEKILGVTPGGNRPRELSLWLAKDESEPRLHVWIHPPDAGGGWEVRVPAAELKETLERVLAAQPEDAPEEKTAPASLVDCFQESRWRPALRRYAQFAEESGWSMPHRLELYGQSKLAFDVNLPEESRQEAFAYVYENLRAVWQVFRGGTSRWDEEVTFAFLNESYDECGPRSVRTLETLSKNETREVLLPFLEKLRDIKTMESEGYPTLAASRFLHFFNPRLFPNFDNTTINREVLQVFGPEFDAYCASAGIADWEHDAAFYGQYLLWASRHIQLADPELFDDFSTWFQAQVEGEEDAPGVIEEIKTYHALIFECIAVGAAKLQLEG